MDVSPPTPTSTLPLHYALPISGSAALSAPGRARLDPLDGAAGGSLLWTASYTASGGRFGLHDPLTDMHTTGGSVPTDRKSTRLTSSQPSIWYAVFCLEKKP